MQTVDRSKNDYNFRFKCQIRFESDRFQMDG